MERPQTASPACGLLCRPATRWRLPSLPPALGISPVLASPVSPLCSRGYLSRPPSSHQGRSGARQELALWGTRYSNAAIIIMKMMVIDPAITFPASPRSGHSGWLLGDIYPERRRLDLGPRLITRGETLPGPTAVGRPGASTTLPGRLGRILDLTDSETASHRRSRRNAIPISRSTCANALHGRAVPWLCRRRTCSSRGARGSNRRPSG